MYKNKVIICGVDTSKLPILKEKEKERLLKEVKNGNNSAREELINGNLRLVLSVIQRFGGRGENPDDLFQVGCIGLIKSIDNFDVNQNVRFSTYAVPMIIGEVRRYLRDNNSIRVSRSVRDLAYRALQVRERLQSLDAQEPTVEQIAKELSESPEAVAAAIEAIAEPMSLYDPVYSDGGDSIYVMDQLSDTTSGDDVWLEDIALREALKTLGERERSIINMRFFRGKTQMEIAKEIGISQAQVSRLEKGALEHIKKQM
jgi:RNA polymerase sporulation-specific sigma factor